MKKIVWLPAVLSMIIFSSCNDEKAPDYDKSIVPPGSTNTIITNPAVTDSNTAAAKTISTQPQLQQVPAAQPVNANPQNITVNQQPAKTAAGMNPPHGQPGHRCDIAVGAPLNSPPGKTTVQQPQVQTTSTSTVAPTPVKTAPGMNPPHGQPGHRCDISVGAPLNSPPTNKPAATVTPVVAPTDPTAARPQPAATNKVADSTKN